MLGDGVGLCRHLQHLAVPQVEGARSELIVGSSTCRRERSAIASQPALCSASQPALCSINSAVRHFNRCGAKQNQQSNIPKPDVQRRCCSKVPEHGSLARSCGGSNTQERCRAGNKASTHAHTHTHTLIAAASRGRGEARRSNERLL